MEDKFEIDFESIYDEINKMDLEISSDPLVGGPGKIQRDLGTISKYMDRLESIQVDASIKLSNLKSLIKNRKTLFRIYQIKKQKDNKDETELEILKLAELLDPIQSLVDIVDNKASFLKNKESRIRLQWRIMEKQISLGARPKPTYDPEENFKYDNKDISSLLDSI